MFADLALQPLAKIWMGNGNERLGTLRDRFGLEIHYCVLGNDIHHVGSWRRNDVSGREFKDDSALANPLLFVGGRKANK